MKRATLQRLSTHGAVMRGVLTQAFSPMLLTTLEPLKTILPAGDYICLPDDTGVHKHWLIVGWCASDWESPSFSHFRVEWHIGNSLKDTKACILPGTGFGIFEDGMGVTDSGDALEEMHSYFGTSNMWALRIKDPPL